MGKNEDLRRMMIEEFSRYIATLSEENIKDCVHMIIPPIYDTPIRCLSRQVGPFFPHLIDEAWRRMGHSFKCRPDESDRDCNACNPK